MWPFIAAVAMPDVARRLIAWSVLENRLKATLSLRPLVLLPAPGKHAKHQQHREPNRRTLEQLERSDVHAGFLNRSRPFPAVKKCRARVAQQVSPGPTLVVRSDPENSRRRPVERFALGVVNPLGPRIETRVINPGPGNNHAGSDQEEENRRPAEPDEGSLKPAAA